MDNKQQIQTISQVLDYETKIKDLKEQIQCINNERYRTIPNPPVHTPVQTPMPEIKPVMKYDFKWTYLPIIIFEVICVLCWFWQFKVLDIISCIGFTVGTTWPAILIWLWASKRVQRDKEIERIKNSAEYKAQCLQIETQDAEQNRLRYEEYEKALREYETVIVPQYWDAHNKWSDDRNARLNNTQDTLSIAEKELSDIYNTTKIVPLQYRSIPALKYILITMQTSEYDVKTAIEIYDRQLQRELDQRRLQEQQIANRQAAEQNYLLEQQNELVAEQNYIADKARREANAAAVVSAVQRHNTNKALNDIRKHR